MLITDCLYPRFKKYQLHRFVFRNICHDLKGKKKENLSLVEQWWRFSPLTFCELSTCWCYFPHFMIVWICVITLFQSCHHHQFQSAPELSSLISWGLHLWGAHIKIFPTVGFGLTFHHYRSLYKIKMCFHEPWCITFSHLLLQKKFLYCIAWHSTFTKNFYTEFILDYE